MARAQEQAGVRVERSDEELLPFLRRAYRVPADPVVDAFVGRFRERHGTSLRAVVFYGSRLTGTHRSPTSLFDFFLLASEYPSFHRRRRDALLNGLLPPSTYHLELGEHRCKYNVVSVEDFRRETSARARDLFLAGRLAKRVGLVWAADEAAGDEVLRGCLGAMNRCLPMAVARLGAEFTVEELLYAVLALSYAAEIRVESDAKVASLLEADEAFYRAIYGRLLRQRASSSAELREDPARGIWCQDPASMAQRRARTDAFLRRSRRRMVARWFKYMATLDGWTDLLLEKVERTKGIRIELTPLQRRYPYLFGWPHFFRLLRKGIVK